MRSRSSEVDWMDSAGISDGGSVRVRIVFVALERRDVDCNRRLPFDVDKPRSGSLLYDLSQVPIARLSTAQARGDLRALGTGLSAMRAGFLTVAIASQLSTPAGNAGRPHLPSVAAFGLHLVLMPFVKSVR